MTKETRTQRTYDHRLRQLVHSTGNIQLALDLGVPRSTARGWLRAEPRPAISTEPLDRGIDELRAELLALRQRVAKLRALLRLVVAILHASGFSLRTSRLPDGMKKRAVLRASASHTPPSEDRRPTKCTSARVRTFRTGSSSNEPTHEPGDSKRTGVGAAASVKRRVSP